MARKKKQLTEEQLLAIEEENKKKREWKELVGKLQVAMGYDSHQKFNTIVLRRIKELANYYPTVVILLTIDECKNAIEWFKTKTFDSDFGKACYLVAIIQNNINDVYKRWLKKEEAAKQTVSIDITPEDLELAEPVRTERMDMSKMVDF